MALPGTSPTRIRLPELDRLESMLSVYSLTLYRKDTRDYRLNDQRSILITTKNEEVLAEELDDLMDKIEEHGGDKHHYEIIPDENFFGRQSHTKVPFDSTIICIHSPLGLARRSTRTGQVYDDLTMQYCPHTSTTLRFFLTNPNTLYA